LLVPNRAEVLTSLLGAVREVQVASGRSPDGIDEASQIVGGIDGFDSLNALEVLVHVSTTLNNKSPERMLEPKPDGTPLTLGDLADRIVAQLEGKHGSA
jgi:hypothetical protein